jgi:hypothetical protein
MRLKGVPSRRRLAKSIEVEPARDFETDIERPLDAEDVALSLLEAKVRAEEARVDLSTTEVRAGLSVRLPRTLITQLQGEAAKRGITPSELIQRALMQYRPLKQAGYRR